MRGQYIELTVDWLIYWPGFYALASGSDSLDDLISQVLTLIDWLIDSLKNRLLDRLANNWERTWWPVYAHFFPRIKSFRSLVEWITSLLAQIFVLLLKGSYSYEYGWITTAKTLETWANFKDWPFIRMNTEAADELGEKKKSHWFSSRDAKVTNQGPVDPSMVGANHASSNSSQVGKRWQDSKISRSRPSHNRLP